MQQMSYPLSGLGTGLASTVGAGLANARPPNPPESPVMVEINRLMNINKDLHNWLDQLEIRLTPVLQPQSPAIADKVPIDMSPVQLIASLSSIGNEEFRGVKRLQDFMERLVI